MSTEGIRFHHQVKQVRSAFAKTNYHSPIHLATTYQLSFGFLKQLLTVGLLSLNNSVYCKGEHWAAEPDMSLDRFLAIARSGPVAYTPEQLKKSTHSKLPDQFDNSVLKTSPPQAVKPRQNLAINLKFTKSKQWNGVLSWYSSHPGKLTNSISQNDQHQPYEQETLEVNGKIYRVVDLEEHVEKALLDFFEGDLTLTIQHRTKKHKTIRS